MKAILEQNDLLYEVELNAGHIMFSFDDLAIVIHVDETTMIAKGLWRTHAETEEDAHAFLEFVTECNRTKFFPKTFLTGSGTEGNPIQLLMELNTPVAAGMNAAQLAGGVRRAVLACSEVSFVAADRFPHLVTWDIEEQKRVGSPDRRVARHNPRPP